MPECNDTIPYKHQGVVLFSIQFPFSIIRKHGCVML